MASQNSSALPAFPVPPASSGSERHVEPVLRAFLSLSFAQMAAADPSQVFLDVATIEDVIEYIVKARQNLSARHWGREPILSFHWQASQVHDLSEQLDARLVEIDQPKIHRFEYDYEFETVFLKMCESKLHYKTQIGLGDHIKNHIAKLLATANDPRILHSLRSIDEPGTALIEYEGKICKQPDVSFGPVGPPPSLVCEVS